MIEQKQNDFLAALFFQPDLTVDDLIASGINTSNSSLQNKEFYKEQSAIQDAFKDEDGKFNDVAFTNYYNSVQQMFNDAENTSWEQAMLNSYEYDKLDPLAPINAKRRDMSPALVDIQNPERRAWGLVHLAKAGDPTASAREVGQQNKVFNPETNQFEDWTPNDLGFFKSLSPTLPPLVLATYDSDTEETTPDGRTIKHKKGEYKLNEFGETYYEYLGNRSSAGKEILRVTDVLTTDGNNWNKYDFFDSDGLNKSAGKVIMHTAARVAPMLIPGVGAWYGALTMGIELAKLLPTLEQSIGGILGLDTSKGGALSGLKNYAQRYSQTSSDYSKENLFSLESIGNIIASSGTQLAQQRLIGQLPLKIKSLMGGNITENTIKWGQQLSLAYMAGTSATETFDAFIEAGADSRVAGLGMIASMLAMNSLMQNDYYKKIIFNGTPLDKAKIRNVVKESAEEVAKSFKQGTITESPKQAANWVKKLSDTITKKMTSVDPTGWFASASSEALEETAEEMAMDGVKALFEGAEKLGLIDPIQFDWSLKNMASRYAASFIGGGIGGLTFKAHNSIETAWANRNKINNKATEDIDKEAMQQMITLIRNGKSHMLRSELQKLHSKGALGSTNLSAYNYDIVKDSSGSHIVYKSPEQGQSQNDAIYGQLNSFIDRIESIMHEEGLFIADDQLSKDIFKNLQVSELKRAENYSYIFSTWNQLTDDIIRYKSKLENLLTPAEDQSKTKADIDAHIASVEKSKEYQDIKALLEQKRKERDDLISGKRNDEFYGHLGFVVNPIYPSTFIEDYGWENWVKFHYGKESSKLTDIEKAEAEEKYKVFQNTAEKNKTIPAWNSAYAMLETLAPAFKNMAQNAVKDDRSVYSDATTIQGAIDMLSQQIAAYKQEHTDATAENNQELATLEQQLTALQTDLKNIQSHSYYNLNRSEASNVDYNSITSQIQAINQIENDEDRRSLYEKLFHTAGQTLVDYWRKLKAEGKTLDVANADWHYLMSIIAEQIQNRPILDGEFLIANDIDEAQGTSYMAELSGFLGQLPKLSPQEAYNAYQKLSQPVKDSLNHTITSTEFGLPVPVMFSFSIDGSEHTFEEWLSYMAQLHQEVKQSAIFNLLDLLASTGSSTTPLSEQARQLFAEFLKSPDVTEFEINNSEQLQDLKNISTILKQLAVLTEMSVSGSFIDNLNNFRTKAGKEALEVMDEETAISVKGSIIEMQDKIDTMLRWHEANSNAKLKEHYEIGCVVRPLFTNILLEGPYKTAFETAFKIDIEEIKNNIEWPEEPITKENFGLYDVAATEFETAVYQAIKNKGYSAESVANSLVSMFMQNGKLPVELAAMKSTKFSKTTTSVTAYDACIYLLSILAHPAINTANKYKKSISRPEYQLAPVFSHEWGAKIAYSLSQNIGLVNIFNLVLNKCAETHASTTDRDYQKARIVLNNTVTLLGGAGTGKTVGGSYTVIGMLNSPKVITGAPTQRQVNKLSKSLGNTQGSYSKDRFLEQIVGHSCSELVDSARINKTEQTWTYNPDKNIDFKNPIFSDTDTERIVVIDEFTQFTVEELDLISRWAQKYDVMVFLMGDRKQDTVTLKTIDKKDNGNGSKEQVIEDTGLDWTSTWSICTPEFTAAFRPTTVAQRENQKQVEYDVDFVMEPIYDLKPENDVLLKISEHYKTPKTLKYAENADGSFTGIKITDKNEDTTKFINSANVNGANIGIVVDKASLSEWSWAKDKGITIINIDDTDSPQGQEFDYFIVAVSPSELSSLDLLRKFYTWSTRAALGTAFIDKGGWYRQFYTSVEDPTSGSHLQMQPQQINDFKSWRLNGLNNMPSDVQVISWGNTNNTVPAVLQGMQFADDIPSDSGNPVEGSPKSPEETPTASTPAEEEEAIIVPGVVEVSEEPTPTSNPNTLEQPNPFIEAETPEIVGAVDYGGQANSVPSNLELTFSYAKSWGFFRSNALKEAKGFALKSLKDSNVPAICAMTSFWFFRGHDKDHQRNLTDVIATSLSETQNEELKNILNTFQDARNFTYITKRIGNYYALCVYPDNREDFWIPIAGFKVENWTQNYPLGIYNGSLSVGNKDFNRQLGKDRTTQPVEVWLKNYPTHQVLRGTDGQVKPIVLVVSDEEKIELQKAIKEIDPNFNIFTHDWRRKMNSDRGKEIRLKLKEKNPYFDKLWYRTINSGKQFLVMSSDPFVSIDPQRELNFDGDTLYDFNGPLHLVGTNAQFVSSSSQQLPSDLRSHIINYIKVGRKNSTNIPWNSMGSLLKTLITEYSGDSALILPSILKGKVRLNIEGKKTTSVEWRASDESYLLNEEEVDINTLIQKLKDLSTNEYQWKLTYNDNGYLLQTDVVLRSILKHYLKGDILPSLVESDGQFSQGLYLEVQADRSDNGTVSQKNGIYYAQLPNNAEWCTDAKVVYDNDIVLDFNSVNENKELGEINAQLRTIGISPISSMADLDGVLQKKNLENKMSTKTGTWIEYIYNLADNVVYSISKTDYMQVIKNLLYENGIMNVEEVRPYFGNTDSLNSGPFIVTLGDENKQKMYIFYDEGTINIIPYQQAYSALINSCHKYRKGPIPTEITDFVNKLLFFDSIDKATAMAYYNRMQVALQQNESIITEIGQYVLNYLQEQFDNEC